MENAVHSGGVVEEFRLHLEKLNRKFASRPRQEMLRLFLLALEREELVSVGYRESLINSRLLDMPIDDEVRDLIRHAMVWIWKDEEMHAIYIRGAIFKVGNSRLRIQSFLRQAAGGVAGWATSVLQHARWVQAPFSRALAASIAAAGSLFGKVPSDVKRHLRYGSFRDFCRFNIDAEKTARLCWERLVELAKGQPDLGVALIADFKRVVEDEGRHGRIFEILAVALDERDRLAGGETVGALLEKIRAVGEHFLPRSRRRIQKEENPLGAGGKVWVARQAPGDEKLPLFTRFLDDCRLRDAIEGRARFLGKPLERLQAAIKPAFMMGYHREDRSPITDPALLEALAIFLRRLGIPDVAVIEGRNIYDHFYRNRAVRQVAEYFDIRSPHFRIVDASEEQVPHQYSRGMAQYSIARTWRDADFRISFAKLRSHPIELALLSVGNVEWVGARCDEFLFLERQADRITATVMLLDEFPPHFALLDAWDQVPDGLVGVMGCTSPKSPRRFYAGADALAVDMVAARHLSLKHPRESSILRAACHWFGGWPDRIEVDGVDEPIRDWRGPYDTELWALLSLMAFPVYVLGSGRGSLFVPEMDEEAFPLIRRERLFLRLGRRFTRALLGLHHKRHSTAANGER
ncbi:MAG: hypothetical protein DMG09_01210 [Acidobacteria bacterium]|nr:MAG: hypothetical protein DMG09_01210 [Acidobacteriota bacterium]